MKHIKSIVLIIGCLLSYSYLHAASWNIDLHQYGYMKPPSRGVYPEGAQSVSQYLDFTVEGNIVAGLVTRTSGASSSIPEFSSLTWRTLVFGLDGKLIAKSETPTKSWHENALFAGSKGTLLIRTANKLTLISEDGNSIAKKVLSTEINDSRAYWWIYPFPNRQSFLLSEAHGQIEVINSGDLKTRANCTINEFAETVTGVSDNRTLIKSNVRSTTGKPHAMLRLAVKRTCGVLEFSFDFQPNEYSPMETHLLSDKKVLMAGSAPSIILYEEGKEQWRDSFDNKHDLIDYRVRADAQGMFFALLIKTFAGGSDFWDTNSHLKAMKVIVYSASNGKRLLEVPITPLPGSIFDFALSRDGKHLAILSDGELRLIPIP
jgi:hypothetical protein